MRQSNFDLSKPKERRFDFSKDDPKKPHRNWFKIVGTTALIAILSGIGFVGYQHWNNNIVPPVIDGPYPPEPIDTPETAGMESISENDPSNNEGATSQETTVDQSNSTAIVSDTNSTESTPIELDNIEKAALSVIRGNYGNNPERRKRLGDRYQVIQDRVNQIYRERKLL